jgi:hypothetical protein
MRYAALIWTAVVLFPVAGLAQSPGQQGADAQRSPELKKAAPSTTVPMEVLKSKHIAVQIKVNGKGPYRVIFDTGSPVTLLSNKIAQEAELLSKEQAKAPALFGARGMGTAKTLEVGDIKVEDMPVMIMDHPALKAAGKVLGQLDGIVGFPFFSHYKSTLDYAAEKITFEPVEYRGEGMDMMQMVMVMMTDRSGKPVQKVQAPTTLWGFQVAKEKSDAEAGVVVKEVLAGSPAAAAGLKVGDRLLELDGTWTESVEDTFRAAGAVAAGQKAKAKIKRGDEEMLITIVPRTGL